ncbi:lectin C-type domain-containing protein [Blumeria hordei DH14]|uniref:Maintenance of telomere capping protein 6 n=1 Tax=Blumeria graminis f. sp. hordei (strain DH14) TaxID=546991 RepID=N1JBM1_BLUG1|nr:lectin C-type domain-containing protein [Blumeria hordei DH14]
MNQTANDSETITQPGDNVLFLTQRDLSLTVPINFVTNPSVSLTAACFSNLNYGDDEDLNTCFRNLMEMGFRRIQIDLYWEEDTGNFSFCPAKISNTSTSLVPTSIPLDITGSTTAKPSSSPTASTVVLDTPADNPISLSTSRSPIMPTSYKANSSVMNIGPYMCSSSLNLRLFVIRLLNYIKDSDSVLEARILYIILNLHAAATVNGTGLLESNPNVFPSPQNLVGQTFSANLSEYFYTPNDLQSDRANLNESWYKVNPRYRTTHDYYTETVDKSGIASSIDGWPAESYVEFALNKRLLLGWGSIDPQMSAYNLSGDSDLIFPSGYLSNEVLETDVEQLDQGCLWPSDRPEINPSNLSWAIMTTPSNEEHPPFNQESKNETPSKPSTKHLMVLTQIALFGHGHPKEPRKYKRLPNTNSTRKGPTYRCATSQLHLSGRWAVSDCLQYNFGACRAYGQPYNWTYTSRPTKFALAANSCPNGYTFAAPRTALENSYLTQMMRRIEGSQNGNAKCWVALDSMDVEGCWVIGGKNNTCPYNDSVALETYRRRTILIPTIAAILVLVVTAITIIAKAADNRRKGRRQNRKIYIGNIGEGVPG